MDSKQVLEIASEIFNTHPTDKDTLAFAAAIEAALLEGKVLVPVEPTEEMVKAGCGEICELDAYGNVVSCKEDVIAGYKVMLQAAPKGGSPD